ncbi:1968_t:CDS:2, partial [Racocetra persica]
MATGFSKLIYTLLEPIPQYVVGCLPAITIVGVFAAINIEGDELSRCIFWLLPEYFVIKGTSTSSEYRPVRFYVMK